MPKTATCICGLDLTDSKVMFKHLLEKPIHSFLVIDPTGDRLREFIFYVRAIDRKGRNIHVDILELKPR